jgi:hypothetical protein
MNWNTARAMLAGGAILIGLVACSATKRDAPEPESGSIRNGTHTRVIKMPNGFRNIAATCEGTTGIYVTSRGVAETDPQPSSVAVLPNDPACAR